LLRVSSQYFNDDNLLLDPAFHISGEDSGSQIEHALIEIYWIHTFINKMKGKNFKAPAPPKLVI
jgi:hypothetical protein